MSDPITPTQDHKDTRILGGSMSITEERAAALQEILADWKQADPAQVWDAFDFEDFNEMVGDLADLLAEVERLRAELAKTREVTDEKVERVAGALAAHWTDRHTNESLGRQKVLARHALYAALGGGDDA